MKAIGIDLGTTNSAAAHCAENRAPKILTTRAGENLTPSVVSVGKQKDILVGRAAANNAVKAPEDTIFSIKRLMGRDFNDPVIARVREIFNYRIVPGPNGDPRAYVRLGDAVHSPVKISSWILEQIKADAEKALSEKVTHAVITVPAYFHEGQRAATREAGEAAGLVIKKIIDEPTAAAIAFGLEARPGQRYRILVYDLGGGTFDISILQMVTDGQGQQQFQVLQMEGDNWLGGDDFDREIIERIINHAKDNYEIDPATDKRFLLLAKIHAEAAKRTLSSSDEADVVIPAACRSKEGLVVDIDFPLKRAEFEDMIQPYVNRSVELVHKALGGQHLTPEDISDVLLVGGSTLTPLVFQTVEGIFGPAKVRRTLNPMECVALGASILASNLRGVECPSCMEVNPEETPTCRKCGTALAAARSAGAKGISEVTPMALGIRAVKETQRDAFVAIIPKNTPYPLLEPMKQRFQATNARRIVVPVFEGNDAVASRNAEQGTIEYELPQEIDMNTPVEVSFNYDQNRELTVTISVPGTGFAKSERLRHDRPRTKSAATAGEGETEETWQDDLDRTIHFVEQFSQAYQQYMDAGQRAKLERDLARAQQLQTFPNETEGRRVTRILQSDLFSSGLATQLFLADKALDGATQEVSSQISQAAASVRKAYERGDLPRAAEETRILKVMVAKAWEARGGVKLVGDQADYGGILKTFQST